MTCCSCLEKRRRRERRRSSTHEAAPRAFHARPGFASYSPMPTSATAALPSVLPCRPPARGPYAAGIPRP
jgi:hypothetical protein